MASPERPRPNASFARARTRTPSNARAPPRVATSLDASTDARSRAGISLDAFFDARARVSRRTRAARAHDATRGSPRRTVDGRAAAFCEIDES